MTFYNSVLTTFMLTIV